MKIRTDDIHRTNLTKYEWVNQFINGEILDITCGKYLSYASSRLLLENNVTEIWSIDILENYEKIVVRKNKNGKITLETKTKEEFDVKKFDIILGFNILSVTENINESIKFIFEHLKNNGQAILSVNNEDKLSNNKYDLNTKDLNLFTKKLLEINLKSYTSNIEFFLQGIIGIDYKEKFKNNSNSKLRKFILKSDKMYNLYFKYLRSSKNKISNINEKRQNKKTHRYEIIPFDEKINPQFMIAKCKKL
jgi:2-polyprenyl-3-methyl-5-hydroxy-6-metoxy-1,4-benzoquinol methylase